MIFLKRHPVWVTVFLVFVLGACTTPYRPPSEPAPSNWLGETGFRNLDDTLVMRNGRMKKGDVISSILIKHKRTAVTTTSAQTDTGSGSNVIIPAGTKMFAMNYSLMRQYGSMPAMNQQFTNNPIEWCAVLKGGINPSKTKPETVCLFWEGSGVARYITAGSRFLYLPDFDTKTDGKTGSLPKFVEQPVDLGVNLTQQTRISQINSKGVRISSFITDGTDETEVSKRFFKWSDKGKINVMNKLSKIEITRVGDGREGVVDVKTSAPDKNNPLLELLSQIRTN